MKKLLVIGIDTRSMLNSALKLDYELYSTSYFSTSDMPVIENQKIIVNEEIDKSCGVFEDQFSSERILEISGDYLDEVDYIIPVSGISPNDFSKKHQKKILGNRDVENLEDKYRFYKKIKNKFLTPLTFSVNDVDEAIEINENYDDKQFILKPVKGNGGYDINLLNNSSQIQFNKGEFILQEYVKGVNVSSSVLASESEAKTVINSRLLTMNDFEKNGSFIYIGNIVPLTDRSIMHDVNDADEINETMNSTSQNLAEQFNLRGSNGVDYIVNENGLHVIEINPRLQGTFECVERALGINMLEAHIMACHGTVIDIPEVKCYSYKKIIYSPVRMKYEKISLDNIHDTPHLGSITEKSEPLLTIIDEDRDFEKLFEKVEKTGKKVNDIARICQLDKE